MENQVHLNAVGEITELIYKWKMTNEFIEMVYSSLILEDEK